MHLVLRIISGKLAETRLQFPPGQYLFGRAQGSHVLFAPTSIASRRHCLLLVAPDGVTLRDLGSRNGTFVNKQRIEGERKLADGDLVDVGETTFQVEINSSLVEVERPSGVEVSGKPIGETIDMPPDRTNHDTKLPTQV